MTNLDTTPAPALQSTPSPFHLLEKAILNGCSPEIISRLMDNLEQHEARLARREFDGALALVSAEIPTIFKAKKGHGYNYEGLDDIARTVAPILARHGLSYRWQTQDDGANILVTCCLSHSGGHTEKNTLSAAKTAVSSRMQNPLQAMGSAITYLQRYTLKAILGLASSNDDDGASVAQNTAPISDAERDHLSQLLENYNIDIAKFCAYFGVSYLGAIKAADLPRALSLIERRASQIDHPAQKDASDA